MPIEVTTIEEFIQEDMTRNEITEDLNGLYSIINEECRVSSRDYRCYVTPFRELIIYLLHETHTFSQDTLIERIYNETVMRAHGIEEIKIVSYEDEAYDIFLHNTEEDIDEKRTVLDDYMSGQIITLAPASIPIAIESYPSYKEILLDISKIKGFSFSSSSALLHELSEDGTTPEESVKITLKDRAIIMNTIEVFLDDAKASEGIDSFRGRLTELNNYLYTDSNSNTNIDENESISEKNQKEKISFLSYFIGTASLPFIKNIVTHNNRVIHIKFYFLLCLAYYMFTLLRKMERTDQLRKNKKRHIDYIHRVLSDVMIIDSPLIIEYLKQTNPQFTPKMITESDIDELIELITILENRPEFYSHELAKAMKTMFGAGHRPINRFLHLLSFKGVGNSTVV